ncbi:MAG: hypothetical protein JO246_00280 [Frankiaceae bacterium]|nr:hypothetical protein [Frankiaceae bacterium]MBV9869542.1 hypothetical protein [Frankiaceae bacterium]
MWIALYVGIAVLGLAVLGGLTFRLWKQVRQFGRDVAAAGQKIAAVTDELAKLQTPSSR